MAIIGSPILSAAEVPPELTSLKVVFLADQKAIADERPEALNESYLKRLGAMSEQAQKDGERDLLAALREEAKLIEKYGQTVSQALSEDSDAFSRLKKLYTTEFTLFRADQLKRHSKLVESYQSQLQELGVTLTVASRFGDALIVRSESDAAAALTLPSSGGPEAASRGADIADASRPKQGRLRAVGRAVTKSFLPWGGGPIHTEVFAEYTDLEQIVGNSTGIMALRENGDVILEDGQVFKDDVCCLFAPYLKFGGTGRDGVFRAYRGKPVPVTQPVVQVSAGYFRDLALLDGGQLAWAGKLFDTGKRIPPPIETRRRVRQIGSTGAFDYVLKEDGEVKRWNNEGASEMPDALREGVKLMACGRTDVWFLTADHRILNGDGERPAQAPEKAQYIADGGDLFAVLGMDDRWTVVAIGETVGNQVSLLETVLNSPSTVDVAFHLANAHLRNENTAAYVAWIEDPSVTAPPIPIGTSLSDTTAPQATNDAVAVPQARSSAETGARFFGVEIR